MKHFFITSIISLMPLISFAQLHITGSEGMKLKTGARMSVYGNIQHNGIFIDNADSLILKGSNSQLISGDSAITFSNLVIANTSGVTLERDVSISGKLLLSSGGLILNGHQLSISNTQPTAVTRNNGYILSELTDNSSRVSWKIDSLQGSYVYPFGTGTGSYIPFTFQLTQGNAGVVTLSTYHTGSDNLPLPYSPQVVLNLDDATGHDNSANTADRFWQIEKTGTVCTATITFTATASEVGSIANLQAQRWNTATQKWEAPLPGQTSSFNTVTVPGVTNFSPWTLAGNNDPLPIKLILFDAELNKQVVDLNWVTSSEVNNSYFTIEKTKNGTEYTEVGRVTGAGNSNTMLSYALTDSLPFYGMSYYRLRQTDFNGDYAYSELVSVYYQPIPAEIRVYPNPADDVIFIQVNENTESELDISLVDINGKKCYQQTISGNQNIYQINVSNLPAGMYTLMVSGMNILSTSKVMIR